MDGPVGLVTAIHATAENGRLGYFRDTVGSVLAQNMNFVWAIVDDGSDDEGCDFLGDLNDPRVRVMSSDPPLGTTRGVSAARNVGLNHLFDRGCDFFTYVDSDDLLLPGSLEVRVDRLSDHDIGCDMVYAKSAIIRDDEVLSVPTHSLYGKSTSPEVLGANFPHTTTMWNRQMMELLRRVRSNNVYEPTIRHWEDLELTLCCRRLLEEGDLKLGYVDCLVYLVVESDVSICRGTTPVDSRERREMKRWIYGKNGYAYINNDSWLRRNILQPGHWLPKSIKMYLRPLKSLISKVSCGRLFPVTEYEKVDVDPYWFRTASQGNT